ncbi:cysteine-rich RLK (RECEPTOR-like protein kinase) 11 [Actinidia rufa]|uniref:Cysteine-rich RLK (RECEPTOR-like protein kinase) 11 n=1 Tax=Actinidia rufa TaxID=165716 RepID=A0A7J0EMT6_9ERIC|nr:cysteine-rich RLK (RECEPTOR-like protein kinase) 11 [Actinidia rufa]
MIPISNYFFLFTLSLLSIISETKAAEKPFVIECPNNNVTYANVLLNGTAGIGRRVVWIVVPGILWLIEEKKTTLPTLQTAPTPPTSTPSSPLSPPTQQTPPASTTTPPDEAHPTQPTAYSSAAATSPPPLARNASPSLPPRSSKDLTILGILLNPQNVTTDVSRFQDVLGGLLRDIVNRASIGGLGKKFATGEANFSSLQTIYALAQCTPDLTTPECNSCLVQANSNFPNCCAEARGARVLFPSCNMRYEIYPFYNATAFTAPPPPVVPLPPPSTGNGGFSSQVLIAIIVPICVIVLLFIVGFCWLRRRATEKYESVREDTVGDDITTDQPLQYDLATLQAATNNFSEGNKIGEGGFGPVYKYVTRGQFSVKSDVFSFGVLVLEIISGKKNSGFDQSDYEDLLSYAWNLWRDERPLDLMDPTLEGTYSRNEVIRCIHIALLCVQDDPDNRPTMATVVVMLNSYSVTLSLPQQPAFSARSRTGLNPPKFLKWDESTSKSMPVSVNSVSITELEPR